MEEVIETGWMERVGDSLKGMAIGAVLFLGSFALLFWNEGNFVKTRQTLEAGAGQVKSVEANKVDSANNDKLVHVSDKATLPEDAPPLKDDTFGVGLKGTKLKRQVQYYQWKEEVKTDGGKKKLGGGKETKVTTTYARVWSPTPINSDEFKEKVDPQTKQERKNFVKGRHESKEWTAEVVRLGAFKLSKDQVDQFPLSDWDPHKDGAAAAAKPAEKPAEKPADDTTCAVCGRTFKDKNARDQHAKAKANDPKHGPAAGAPKGAAEGAVVAGDMKAVPGGFYSKGGDPNNPTVGDVKVTYQAAVPGEISVVAGQSGDSFKPFTIGERSINLAKLGKHSAEKMFEDAQAANAMLTWILRFVGFLAMAIGFYLVFNPLAVLADVLPILGSFVAAGIAIVAALVAGAFSLITIAIAWIFYRPMIGIPLLLVAAVLLGLVIFKGKSAQAAKGAAPSA